MLVLNVKPNSKTDQILTVDDNCVSLSISDPARDGQANDAIVAFLAQTLNIKKYNLEIVRGHKSHQKLVKIDNCKDLGLNNINHIISLLKG